MQTKNKLKTIQWNKSRNCGVVEIKKEDSFPTFKSVHSLKLKIRIGVFKQKGLVVNRA